MALSGDPWLTPGTFAVWADATIAGPFAFIWLLAMAVPTSGPPDCSSCGGGFSGMATNRCRAECPSWFPTDHPSSSSLTLLARFESLQMQWVSSRGDGPCPQSATALRQKASAVGFLRLGPTQVQVPVTGFLHSLHSPPCLTEVGHSLPQSPSMALGPSVPNPVRYLTTSIPALTFSQPLSSISLTINSIFPPALHAEELKSNESWPSPMPPVSVHPLQYWTYLPLFLQSSGDGIGAVVISKASISWG